MKHYSRTAIKELRKRYLTVLKKCFLLNMGMILFSTPTLAATETITQRVSNSSTLSYSNPLIFKNITLERTESTVYGGAVNNTASLNFKNQVTFEQNKASGIKVPALGGAISNTGTLTFEGISTFTGNTASATGSHTRGGAISNYGESAITTFNKDTVFKNTTISTKAYKNTDGTYAVGSAEGGAINNYLGTVTFKEKSTFEGNKASSEGQHIHGGVFHNTGASATTTFTKEAIFKNSTVSAKAVQNPNESITTVQIHGGAINNYLGRTSFLDKVTFEGNTASVEGGNIYASAVYNEASSSVLSFNGDVIFKNNTATAKPIIKTDGTVVGGGVLGGALSNSGTVTFSGLATFEGNTVSGEGYSASGAGIYNSGTAGKITFNKEAIFKNNTATSKAISDGTTATGGSTNGSAILNNDGTIIFKDKATFESNSMQSEGTHNHGGALSNSKGNITFDKETIFKNNSATSKALLQTNGKFIGGTVHSGTLNNYLGTITFNDKTTFESNRAYSEGGASEDGSSTHGGAIYNEASDTHIIFNKDAIFKNNINEAKALYDRDGRLGGGYAFGGAISNNGSIIFNGNTTFEGNKSISNERITYGGAIYNEGESAVLTFNSSFAFTGNKTVSSGTETSNDIHNLSTINFAHGYAQNGSDRLVGSLEGGIINTGTINKTGEGILLFKDETINSGNGTFNQTAGITIAHSEHFLTGINNIFGGTLETHGTNINYSAQIGDGTNNAQLIHHSTAGINDRTELNSSSIKIATNATALFDSALDSQAYYTLADDVAGAGTITFKNSNLNLQQASYTGAYQIDASNTIDLRQDKTVGTSVHFDNLSAGEIGTGATLAFDLNIITDSSGNLSNIETDKFSSTSNYLINNIVINSLNNTALDNGIQTAHQTNVLKENAQFKEGLSKTLATSTSTYLFNINTAKNDTTGLVQDITLTAKELKDGSALGTITKMTGDSSFQMVTETDTLDTTADYIVTEDLTPLGSGKKQILGATNNASDSTIYANGKDLFTLNKAQTELDVQNISISAANTVVNNQNGVVKLENVVISGTNNDTSIQNASSMILSDVQVDKGIKNTGELTLTNVEAEKLTNNNLTTVNGGTLKVNEISGSGTLSMNNAELDATSIATANTIISNGMRLSDNLKKLDLETLKIKENTVLNLNLATATINTIENKGSLQVNKDLNIGALNGHGTLSMNNSVLHVADSFSSNNKLEANNLSFSSNVKDLSFKEVAVQENSFLDIGKSTLSADSVLFNDNSKLITHINTKSNTDFGKISAHTINVSDKGTEIGIIVNPGEHFSVGYKDFKILNAQNLNATAQNGFETILENPVYDIYYLGDGEYRLTVKKNEKCKGIQCVLDAWILGPAITEDGKPKDIQNILNDSAQTFGPNSKEVIEALEGLAPNTSPLTQAYSTEIMNRLSSIISKQLHSSIERTGYYKRGKSFYLNPRRQSHLWVQGLYGQSEFDAKKGFDMDTQGLAVGFDGHISPDTRLGVAYAYTTADGTAVQRDTEVTSHTISVYGEYNPNRFYANWLGLYTRSNYEENKKVFHHRIKAEYDVDVFGAQVMFGRKMGPYVIGNWASGVISPEAGLRYTYIKQHGYTDDAGQKVGAADGQILTGILGAQYTIGYTLAPGLAWYPELRAALTYDFIQPDMENSVTLVNGARYDVVTENLDKFGIEIGARVGLDINRKTEVALEYEGLFKGDYTNHTGLASLKYKF